MSLHPSDNVDVRDAITETVLSPLFATNIKPLSSLKTAGHGSRKNTCMRLFWVSATYTLPVVGFTATPIGLLNWPSPVPKVPNFVMNAPLESNTWILLLPFSATYTLPDAGFTAMLSGKLNWPSPEPPDPNFVMNAPLLASNTWMRLLESSVTYTLPVAGFTATPTGPSNWPSPVTEGAELCDEGAVAVKHLDSVVACVCHKHVARRGIYGNA